MPLTQLTLNFGWIAVYFLTVNLNSPEKKALETQIFYAFQMLRISPRRRISSGLYLLLWTVSPPLYPVRASGQRTEYLTISTAVTPSKSDSIEREASRVVVPMLIDANVVKKSRQIFLSATFFQKRIWQPCF